jgi:hypothetical protein
VFGEGGGSDTYNMYGLVCSVYIGTMARRLQEFKSHIMTQTLLLLRAGVLT